MKAERALRFVVLRPGHPRQYLELPWWRVAWAFLPVFRDRDSHAFRAAQGIRQVFFAWLMTAPWAQLVVYVRDKET